MYLKISNRGSMSRDAVRLVGFTTKSGEPVGSHVIGQWGTGTAFATVAALRLGLDVAIASNDLLGPFVLRFEVEETKLGDGKTVNEVVLSYWVPDGAGGLRNNRMPWNIALAAFRDWDKPIGNDDSRAFKVLREFICNARDEDLDFTIETVAEQTFAPEGYTHVFITRNEETDRVLDRPARYFKFLDSGPRLTVPGVGFVTAKSEKGATRLFVQGVLVSCDIDLDFLQSSLLDYDIEDRRFVSEDRTVKRHGDFRRELGRLISGIEEPDVVRHILETATSCKASVEKEALGTVETMKDDARAVWLRVLHDIHRSERLCIASGNTQTDEDARQLYRYQPISVDGGLWRFLNSALGIPYARDVAPPQPEVTLLPFAGFNGASRRRFMEAFRVFATFFPQRAHVPVRFFISKRKDVQEKVGAIAGSAGKIYEEIWIQAKSETELPSFADMLWLLVHESRHCAIRAGDYERPFVMETQSESFGFMARLWFLMAASGDATKLSGRAKDFYGKAMPAFGDPTKLLPNILDPPADAETEEVDIDLTELE